MAAISPCLPVEQRSVGWRPPPILRYTSLTLPARWAAYTSLFRQIRCRPRALSPVGKRRNDEDMGRREGNIGHDHMRGETMRCRDTFCDTMSLFYLCINLTRSHALQQGRET